MSNEPLRLVAELKEAVSQKEMASLRRRIQRRYPRTQIEDLAGSGVEAAPAADGLHSARRLTLAMDPTLNPRSVIFDLSQIPELAKVSEARRPSPPSHPAVAKAGLLPQPHLGPAPHGIGAVAAHERRGGRGQGMRFIDLESGWNLRHVDLLDLNIGQPLYGVSRNDREHGTAVLGVVAARGKRAGSVIGIAPGLKRANVISPLLKPPSSKRYIMDSIKLAAKHLSFGDVLLIEAQISHHGVGDIPAEVVPGLAKAIRGAVNRGIVVIEPAGNKRASLDELEVDGRRMLDVDWKNFKDSGAILVAAATADVPHRRHRDTSFGRRVDCYGWGERVVTCGGRAGNGVTDHTDEFSGTSAAAAMVAGIALCVQGMAKAKHGKPFDPLRLRDILRDPANGTLPKKGEKGIGVMPDLAKIVRRYFP